jgi:DNA-directed RNA polymerase specialized sigma24 family protein
MTFSREVDLSNPTAAEASEPDDPNDLPPLTRNGYTRLPAAEADIRALLDLPSDALDAAFAVLDQEKPGFRTSESLIFFIRRLHRRGDTANRDKLFNVLIARCQRYFRGAARGMDDQDRMEIQQEVYSDIAKLVLAKDDSGDFLESRFLTYLKRETAKVRGIIRKRHHRAPLIGDLAEGAEGEEAFIASHRHEQMLIGADAEKVREAVAELPPELREIVVLRYFSGWQIGDERSAKAADQSITLAKKYEVTPRTIHNWLAKAYGLMAQNWKDDQ